MLTELSDPDLKFDRQAAASGEDLPYGLRADVEGTLADSPIPHLLVHLMRHAQTGTLAVRGPSGEDVRLFVRRGAPAKLASELTASPLGEILVRMGALTDDELEDAIARARILGEPIGVHLVRERWIERPVLHAALRRQIIERLAAAQALPPESTYAFFEGADLATDWRGEEPVPCDPLSTLLAAVRAWPDEARMDGALARLDGVVLRLHPDATPARFGLLASERLVVDAITTFAPTPEILGGLGLDAHAIRSVLYALAITRHLAIGKHPEPPLCVVKSPGVIEELVAPRAAAHDPRSEEIDDEVRRAVITEAALATARDEARDPAEAEEEDEPAPITPRVFIPSIVPRSTSPMRASELARSLIPPPVTSSSAPPPPAELDVVIDDEDVMEPEPPSAVDRFLAAGDWFDRAETALAAGDFAAARRDAESAADADPSRPEYRALVLFVGAVGAPAADQRQALLALDRLAHEVAPAPRVFRCRAQLLHLLGRAAEAKRDYTAALALDPADEVSAHGLAALSAADARKAREGR